VVDLLLHNISSIKNQIKGRANGAVAPGSVRRHERGISFHTATHTSGHHDNTGK